jgi:hypothetical protein
MYTFHFSTLQFPPSVITILLIYHTGTEDFLIESGRAAGIEIGAAPPRGGTYFNAKPQSTAGKKVFIFIQRKLSILV